MGTVVFSEETFKARYPEFAAVGSTALAVYFSEATIYLSNSASSRVTDLDRRLILLNMLVAHIAKLSGAIDGEAQAVGRVSSATEGSVSATLEYITPGSGAWFCQTQYGATFWNATKSMRSAVYRPCPTRY